MTSPGKNVYLISIANAANQMVQYCIVAAGLSAAIAQAQTAAGVTSDPATTQRIPDRSIDYEV